LEPLSIERDGSASAIAAAPGAAALLAVPIIELEEKLRQADRRGDGENDRKILVIHRPRSMRRSRRDLNWLRRASRQASDGGERRARRQAGDFVQQLLRHRVAEILEIIDDEEERAGTSGDVLAIPIGQAAGGLGVARKSAIELAAIVDDGKAVD